MWSPRLGAGRDTGIPADRLERGSGYLTCSSRPAAGAPAAPRALLDLVAMMVHIHSLVFRRPLLIKNSIVMGTGSPAPGILPVPPKSGLTTTGMVQNHPQWYQRQNTGR